MDSLKNSWPGLGMECPFCSHSKCRTCLDVSVNILACCKCRARAIRRLAYLKEVYSSGALRRNEEPQLNPSIDEKVHAGDKSVRRLPVR